MISVGRKNLFQEKTRLFISVGGVAFAVVLMLTIQGLYQGWNKNITAFISSVDADFWIAKKGSADMFHSVSFVPKDLESKVKTIPGVEEVNQFIGQQIAFDLKGKKVNFFLVGYDTEKNIGKPLKLLKGKEKPDRNEIIIDIVFARNKNLKIDDSLEINNKKFKVVGLSEGGNMIVYQYVFVKKEDAEEIFGMYPKIVENSGYAKNDETKGFVNYLLVKAEEGKEGNVKEYLEEKLNDYETKPKEEFLNENKKLLKESFLPIIFVLNIIALFIGTSLIGLTIYTSTVEKEQEFGVLKAIGASNFQLFKIFFEQGFISSTLGYFVGVGSTFLLLKVIKILVPAFTTIIGYKDLLLVFSAAILMSIFAAYIPIRKVMRIDPARVFRA
ncbi:MAG: FtsX-like permease family protein [Actinobacteria bacterium]|nr:FtsX-like permease family protein [Actinomycetota bacterium]